MSDYGNGGYGRGGGGNRYRNQRGGYGDRGGYQQQGGYGRQGGGYGNRQGGYQNQNRGGYQQQPDYGYQQRQPQGRPGGGYEPIEGDPFQGMGIEAEPQFAKHPQFIREPGRYDVVIKDVRTEAHPTQGARVIVVFEDKDGRLIDGRYMVKYDFSVARYRALQLAAGLPMSSPPEALLSRSVSIVVNYQGKPSADGRLYTEVKAVFAIGKSGQITESDARDAMNKAFKSKE